MAYEDKDMFYDDVFEQYVLYQSYPLNRLALPENMVAALGKGDYMQKLCYEASEDLYHYIYDHGIRRTIPLKQYAINNFEKERLIMKKAMLYQLRYYMRSGGGALKDMTGVDLQKSKAMDIAVLRGERTISPSALSELRKSDYLLYTGDFRLYTEDGDE